MIKYFEKIYKGSKPEFNKLVKENLKNNTKICLLYTSPSPRD